MKLYDSNTEMQIIRSACDSPQRMVVLSKLTADHFGFESAKEVYLRIVGLIAGNKPVPSSDVLKNDEAISDASRALISSTEFKVLSAEEDIAAAVGILDKYRKARIIFSAVTKCMGQMQQSDPDVDEVVSNMEIMLQKCHQGSENVEMVHYCAADAEKLAKEIEEDLRNTTTDHIPTGFAAYDKEVGGYSRKSVIVLASVPGGGKSAMAAQMAANQYMMGYNVCYISYEMAEIELRYRILASQSKIEHKKINLKKLTDKQIGHINKSFREFVGSQHHNRFTIWTPTRDLNIQEISMELKPYNYDVIYVDYISLLKADPKLKMHEVLGNHARHAKLAANSLNSVFVLLAQYDNQEEKIKYSAAIQANAHVVWAWDYGEKERASGVLEIKQLKSRASETFPFYLAKDYKIFSFSDYFGPPPPDTAEGKDKNEIPQMPELT